MISRRSRVSSARAFIVSGVCVAALTQTVVVYGQESLPSPLRASSDAPATTVTRDAEITAAQAGAAQPAPPPPDFLHQEELTGEWGGARTTWKNKGVELASSLTQFYQGVAAGGVETGSEYNGTAQAKLTFDLGKLAGWNFWSAEIKAETRFGGPLLLGTGTISLSTAAVIAVTNEGLDWLEFWPSAEAQQLSACACVRTRADPGLCESPLCMGHSTPSAQHAMRASGVGIHPAQTAAFPAIRPSVSAKAARRWTSLTTSLGCSTAGTL